MGSAVTISDLIMSSSNTTLNFSRDYFYSLKCPKRYLCVHLLFTFLCAYNMPSLHEAPISVIRWQSQRGSLSPQNQSHWGGWCSLECKVLAYRAIKDNGCIPRCFSFLSHCCDKCPDKRETIPDLQPIIIGKFIPFPRNWHHSQRTSLPTPVN